MEFVNRFQELEGLRKVLFGGRPALVRVYGRRRLGKTELLRKLCAEQDGLYLLMEEADPVQQRDSLSDQVAGGTGGLRVPFRSWDAFWEYLPKVGKRFVVLDAFQRVLAIDPLAVSRLQHHWDASFQHSGPSLVLCGSSVGMMQRLTTRRSAPLFGRLTGDLRLRPFGYAAVRLLYPGEPEEERVRRYAVFGGTPYYHTFAVGRKDLFEGIRTAFLEPIAPLVEEPQNLLRLELKSPSRYNSILLEIAKGTHGLRGLESKVGVSQGGLGPYLETLRHDLDLVEMEEPVCGGKKRARYILADPFFAFYFRFIFPNRPLLELGSDDQVLDQIKENLNSYVALQFDRIAQEALRWINGSTWNGVPMDFDQMGRWWNRSGEEIDLVARGEREVLLGEVKWSQRAVGMELLQDLERKSELVEGIGGRPIRFTLISKSGFTPELLEVAPKRRILLLDLEGLSEIFDRTYGKPGGMAPSTPEGSGNGGPEPSKGTIPTSSG